MDKAPLITLSSELEVPDFFAPKLRAQIGKITLSSAQIEVIQTDFDVEFSDAAKDFDSAYCTVARFCQFLESSLAVRALPEDSLQSGYLNVQSEVADHMLRDFDYENMSDLLSNQRALTAFIDDRFKVKARTLQAILKTLDTARANSLNDGWTDDGATVSSNRRWSFNYFVNKLALSKDSIARERLEDLVLGAEE